MMNVTLQALSVTKRPLPLWHVTVTTVLISNSFGSTSIFNFWHKDIPRPFNESDYNMARSIVPRNELRQSPAVNVRKSYM